MHGSSFDILDPSLNLKKNYFLEASAGTGKTFSIENAVVRLVQEGLCVDQILIVTFTRAAALEIKTRIRKSFELKKMKKALASFDDAKIYTIHSFCFHTLKEFALETGFPLELNEECGSIAMFKRMFKDFLRTELTEEEMHPKQLHIILKKHSGDLDVLLKELLVPNEGPGKSFQEISKSILDEISRLSFDKHQLIEDLIKHAPLFAKMSNRQRQIKPEIEAALSSFLHVLEGDFEHAFENPIKNMVPGNLLKNKGPYPDTLNTLNQHLIPLLNTLSDRKALLNRLAYRFQVFVSNVSEKEDLFFYDSLLKHMKKAVQNLSFCESVRRNYRAVLIDEFQDTDAIQWNIFSTLFLGHLPLYLVGDPKQSIYRFRGADLYTYISAREEMGTDAYATLTRNFRSDPSLVRGLNDLFSRAPELIKLPKTQETLCIQPIEPGLPDLGEGKMIFCEAQDENDLFSYINHEIEQLNQAAGISFGSCAVLVKDRYQAKRFHLQCPLPVVLKRSETLAESETMHILQDLLLAVYNPRDRQAMAKVLGGPLFSIPLEALKASIEDTAQLFFKWRLELQQKGILSFFRMVCRAVGFPSTSFYLELLQLVELVAEHSRGFEDYIPYLYKLKLEDKESDLLKARIKAEGDAVQVMTMHVSKGLEFDVVFPVGLICPFDTKDEEGCSEKMRQLYVALTRAKKRLYMPIVNIENSPLKLFFSEVLRGESLDSFIQGKEHFSRVVCAETKCAIEQTISPNRCLSFVQRNVKPQSTSSKSEEDELHFPDAAIHSFSSLSKHNEFHHAKPIDNNSSKQMPTGVETGTLLHSIFEKIDFVRDYDDLATFIVNQLKETHLEAWYEQVLDMIKKTLHYPLSSRFGTFKLSDVNPKKMIREMEFLYTSKHPEGYIKGFMDLFFEHNGVFYIIDWKSNYLDNYSKESMLEAIIGHQYNLQADIYSAAAQKYLKLFNCENQFGGVFYIFLRGLDASMQKGVYFIEPKEK